MTPKIRPICSLDFFKLYKSFFQIFNLSLNMYQHNCHSFNISHVIVIETR
jgi:hypothetical protein